MKKLLYMFGILLFAFCSAFPSKAQEESGPSGRIYKVEKENGKVFIGRIVSQDAREVVIETRALGVIAIPKHEVKRISEVKPGEVNEEGEYAHPEVFATRYFFTTNGLPIEKGESYVLWHLFGPDVQFGVTKNISLGIMSTWLATPIVGSVKFSIPLSEFASIGVGLLAGTGSWTMWGTGGVLPYGCFTLGNRRSNITLSGGFATVFHNGATANQPLTSVAGMLKLSKKFTFVFDSFILMPDGSNSSLDIAFLTPGFRLQTSPEKAFQFGFTGIKMNDQLAPVPLPTLGWFRKF